MTEVGRMRLAAALWRAAAARALVRIAGPAHPVVEEPPGPPPPPQELIEFLRQFGVALCQAGDQSARITVEMEELAQAYGVPEVHFFVVPTGVFVRIDTGEAPTVDFAPAELETMRLDQIGRIYDLLNEAKATRMPPAEGVARLAEIRASPPRFPALVRVIGHALLTAGLGLVLNADPRALLGYLVLGALVGVLQLIAGRVRVLSLALPVVAAILVTALVYQVGHLLVDTTPTQLLIPALVTFLPGAALTLGATEMASGSIVGGSSRLVSGMYVLLLLAFGILIGTQLVGYPGSVVVRPGSIGWWAPWVGVLVFGLGQYLASCAPVRSLPWLAVTLYVAWTAQWVAGQVDVLFGAFAGGLVAVPIAYAAQRHHGPPAQVVFLPTFWLLVPGALGLTGVSELVGAGSRGLSDLLTALLSIIAIALGVLVGSSFSHSVARHLYG